MRKERNAYANAIERVREAHRDTLAIRNITVVCPKCNTKQVIQDAPGMRKCVSCGFEFRPFVKSQTY